MKKLFSLVSGLTLILCLVTTSYATNPLPVSSKRINVLMKKHKNTDAFYPVFTFRATSTGAGYYDIVINYLVYDEATGEFFTEGCPSNVTIQLTSGPYAGNSFTFPAGSTSYDLGSLPFKSDPSGNDYSMISNPATINSYPVQQTLFGGPVIP